MSETFSILIDSRSRFETGQPGGEWLSMPTTTEQLHAAMKSVGITAEKLEAKKVKADQKAAEEAKKSEAEAVVKKLLAGGMSADEILEKLK